ncbi:LysR family transcriptional regulator [Saccharopolyspora sp. HNM0983]|uniref:LysR family transcriptional regulator n=1 Tax=Saccharopolyspora montiporae TaxID=2781240 RepID=A0A929B5N2_9PSEU|nr:LysR family transcriptional regulator [Saccharopolyspora sp. HNM0983]MBE9373649.1 LysR family transcriptional regulator [Saccharopolyspora sp. HNM0983]
MLTWERLRVFAAVAEHSSITAAADALHLTRPAVSQHLRKLERETGSALVEPDGRGIRLTNAGQVLAATAHSVTAAINDAERDLANIQDRIVGPLHVGSVASALRSFVVDALREVTEQHPQVAPTVRDGEVIDLIPQLRARRLDAVVLESWSGWPARMPPGVVLTELLTEQVQLAVPADHPLAARPVVHVENLHGQRWASCPPGTEGYEALVQTMRARSIDVEVDFCAADYTTQLSVVAAGMAVALIPGIARPAQAAGVRFVPCEPAVHRTVSVATAETRTTPAVRTFVTALQAAARR